MLINKKSIISFGLITCMLMPKIDLIPVPGYHQGLRYDDLILLTGLIYILLQRKIFLHVFPGRKIYFVFYGIILAYGILSLYEFGFISIIIGLRWLEYSIFFVLLSYSSLNSGHIRKFIVIYIFINSIVVILQYYGLMGGIYSHGYQEAGGLIIGRVAGITGGAWELSAVISLFTVSLIYDKDLKYNKKIILIIISTILLYLSGTRTGMVAFVIVTMFALFQVYKFNFKIIILLISMSTLFIYNTRREYHRDIGDITLDGSVVIRLYHWYDKFILMDYYDYIWGKGLGFSGIYMDGMYVKIFLDMGIIGILLFFAYYYIFLKSFKGIALVAVICSLSIDFFTASKIMFALYLSVYYLSLMSHKPFLGRLDKRWKQNYIPTQRNENR